MKPELKSAMVKIILGDHANDIGGGSSDAKREGWDDATSEPEDFPLGPACDLSGEGGCEACQ